MEYFSNLKAKLIYVFRIPDAAHSDCLKIGEATFEDGNITLPPNSSALNKAAKARIDQYTKTAGITYELLHTEIAIFVRDGKIAAVNDKEVHEVLLRSGIKRKVFDKVNGANEWFCCDLETAKRAIAAVKEGRKALKGSEVTVGQSPIQFRPEQREAIDKTLKQFKKGNQMLWNAKMRFGKTLSALQVVKERGDFRRVLILTHRPVVDAGWFEDFGKIFYDNDEYAYGSKTNGDTFVSLERRARRGECRYIYFASMQDLRGSELVGGNFDKNNDIFSTPWDLIIVDEAHEGTQTELGKAVMKELTKEKTKVLRLSGTPFNLLDDFKEEEIYTWDYVMEQRAKAQWDIEHPGDHNPYAGLPRLNIYTYDLGRLMNEYADEDIAFNFREFFRVNDSGEFVHRSHVQNFLDLLTKTDEESMYPFANKRYRDIFRHTLWMVPGVKSAKALAAMLRNHPVFGLFEIVNVAGDGDEEEANEEALKKVTDAIGPDPDKTRSITLSCGRLTTGVSVKPWMGVFMLSGSFNTAASAYMQTIFRVQTPATINGRVKEDCYVFDFAPDRTLKVLAETAKISTKAGKQSSGERQQLGEFLNFCPIISIEGSQMKQLDTEHMLQQLKRVYVERVVQNGFEDGYLYNDELMKLSDVDISKFEKLKDIIGQTKAMGKPNDITVNDQGLTNEEYEEKEKLEKKKKRELTPEEKERLAELKAKKEGRDKAISILRGISIRMPLLIYGAKIIDEDSELTIDNFTSLVDDLSWEEFMPKGVTKEIFGEFIQYYDPDIFTAAAKRIRVMARAADRLSIEERIERIAAIFATFRNPDKETVLTPWRVVNMHMSDTLGGYTFFNEDFSETIEEPRFVDRGDVTAEVFTPGSHLLEINSKSGLYPLYLAYNIYRSRLRNQTFSPETLEEHQAIWDKVIAENIFVICMTPMAKSITRRTLLGFRPGKVNTRYFEDLINQLKNKSDNIIAKIAKGQSFWKANSNDNMKFKAIVGNPPYQLTVAKKETENGQKAVVNIFHYFQLLADKVARFSSLIYPGGRWIHASGKGLAQFGKSQINDCHLSKLIFYPDSTELFENVWLGDGISIVLKDSMKESKGFIYEYHNSGMIETMNRENPGDELMPLNPFNLTIVKSINETVTKHNLAYLHDFILPRSLFSIESDFVEKNPTLVREYSDGDRFDAINEIKLFTNDKAGKSGRARWYIAPRHVITTGESQLAKWKVVVSSANAGGQKRSNQIAILDNLSAFGRSRLALRTFDTKEEAINFFNYANTEFIRFAFLLTDESLTSLAKQVPDILDYSSSNLFIDFSQDLNSQLYRLFNIDETTQAYIRETLKQYANNE